MEETKKLVSIFVPYYNDSAFLHDSINSILRQSYENFELILLDHASTDNSVQIARSYTDSRIKHISLPKNLGAGGGILLAEFLKVAKGFYVKLFCADDVMHVDCIATLVDYMEANPHIDVLFGNIQYVDRSLKSLKNDWFNNRRDFDKNDGNCELLNKFKGGNVLPYIGNLIKRDAFAGVQINKTFIIMFDMSLWLEMLFNGNNFAFIDKIVASYRIHKDQIASIENSVRISASSFYESIAYYDIFYSYIKNLTLLRAIFAESPFVDMLKEEDSDLFEFVIAHAFLAGNNKTSKINGYLRLEKMFSDDVLRNKIESRFSYGIAEFRKDYLGVLPTAFKKKIYRKQPEHLNIGDIAFLLVRSLWDIVSFKKARKKKSYTV